jgi:hypothetical protein
MVANLIRMVANLIRMVANLIRMVANLIRMVANLIRMVANLIRMVDRGDYFMRKTPKTPPWTAYKFSKCFGAIGATP